MPQAILRTERLVLVPLRDEHIELEVELDADPDVMRFLTGYARTRAQVVDAHRLRMASAEVAPGLGFWVGFADGDFVGWWLLEPPDRAERVERETIAGQAELGYRLLQRRWRQGFAKEGCRELLRHAFEDLGLYRVFGLTMADNTASQATMVAVGLHRRASRSGEVQDAAGSEHGEIEYEITRDTWVPRSHVE